MVLCKLVERGLGLVSTIILARLLLPQDFGLVAMAMSLVAGLELMGAFSFDIALIQNQNAERRHYDTVWTFNALFAAFCALALLVLAKPAAQVCQEHRLENITYVLAFATLVGGFENIGIVFFRKELTFAKEFRFMLRKRLVGFFVTIPLAFTLESYWALVAGIVAMKAGGHAELLRPSISALFFLGRMRRAVSFLQMAVHKQRIAFLPLSYFRFRHWKASWSPCSRDV